VAINSYLDALNNIVLFAKKTAQIVKKEKQLNWRMLGLILIVETLMTKLKKSKKY
jgi:hypothetical protein